MKIVSVVGGILTVIGIILIIVAYIAHVIWVVQTLAGELGVTFGQILLMILGTFVPPIGIIHGFTIIF